MIGAIAGDIIGSVCEAHPIRTKGAILPVKVRASWCMARVQAAWSRLRSMSVD